MAIIIGNSVWEFRKKVPVRKVPVTKRPQLERCQLPKDHKFYLTY